MENPCSGKDDWQDVLDEFQHKSDRAAAILGAAFLHAHLGQLIGCYLVDDRESAANLPAPSSLLELDRPLGTFSARVRAAYALGLLSKSEFHDLNSIVEIQHVFANDVDGAAFEDAGIRDQCHRLRIPRDVLLPGETRTPRQLFVFATAILTQHLACRAAQAEKDRRTIPGDFMMVDADE